MNSRLPALKVKSGLTVLLAAVVLLGLATTFAIELAGTQAHNRADVRLRVHQRGVLAGALIDGLFGTVGQQASVDRHDYGARRVSPALLNRNRQSNAFLAVLDSSGAVLAHSRGLTPQLARELSSDSSVSLARRQGLYGLGNVVSTPAGPRLTFATRFSTRYGERTLVSGFDLRALSAFLVADLSKIPGVRGEANYVIDGNGVILAGTRKGLSDGARFGGPRPSGGATNFSRDQGGDYFDEVRVAGSDWRIVLELPDGPLYASVSGINQWLPWVIFLAFALAALLVFGLLGRVFRAVGQSHEANDKLARVNRQLEASNALLGQRAAALARSNEDLDKFASIASHDLQEPLRKVRTFTQELTRIEGDSLSDKGRDYLRRANTAAERMQTLIDGLLKFSRVTTDPEGYTPVDLERATEEVLDDLAHSIERSGARVHVGSLPTIDADPLQIRQLLQNLISNAVKFQAPDVEPEIWIDARTSGDDVELSLRDNGIGFDQRFAERIFGVFERLHGLTEYSGTGIGLALCRKIAERHGGTITAVGQPGAGATFTVTLPKRQARVSVPSDQLDTVVPQHAGAHV